MADNPYGRFTEEELIRRDHLAVDRTILANERTLLAYIGTALALFVTGVSFIQFFNSVPIEIVGWVVIPAGIVTFAIGFVRYKKMKSLMPGR